MAFIVCKHATDDGSGALPVGVVVVVVVVVATSSVGGNL